MRCCTCKWADIHARNLGNCHGQPPQVFFQQWWKMNGEVPPKVDPREGNWMQLWPATASALWPPIDPRRWGCRLHRFSLRNWLRWLRMEHHEPQSDLTQDRGGSTSHRTPS